MLTKALLLRWESQTDEDTMDTFLDDLAAEVSWERTTQAWFGIRYMRGEFGVFTVFPDEAGREAHLKGKSAQKIFAEVHRLVTAEPKATLMEVLAYKLPPELPEDSNKGLVLRFRHIFTRAHFAYGGHRKRWQKGTRFRRIVQQTFYVPLRLPHHRSAGAHAFDSVQVREPG